MLDTLFALSPLIAKDRYKEIGPHACSLYQDMTGAFVVGFLHKWHLYHHQVDVQALCAIRIQDNKLDFISFGPNYEEDLCTGISYITAKMYCFTLRP